MLKVDMWYKDMFIKKKYRADAHFNGLDSTYAGNIYNEDGKVIGDYISDDSIEIESAFIIQWLD